MGDGSSILSKGTCACSQWPWVAQAGPRHIKGQSEECSHILPLVPVCCSMVQGWSCVRRFLRACEKTPRNQEFLVTPVSSKPWGCSWIVFHHPSQVLQRGLVLTVFGTLISKICQQNGREILR